jgi:hypothetical protein
VLDAVDQFLSTSRPCLLVVHPDIGQLADAARELLSIYDWSHLSVGSELSEKLLSETSRHRSLAASRWLKARLRDSAPGTVLCTEIDLLFDPTFHLDPLKLFCHVGRVTRLVVTWPGSYQADVLSYAVPDHSHYRIWRRPEVPIVTLE